MKNIYLVSIEASENDIKAYKAILYQAKRLLDDVYHWSCENNHTSIESVMSCADSCIIDAENYLDKLLEVNDAV